MKKQSGTALVTPTEAFLFRLATPLTRQLLFRLATPLTRQLLRSQPGGEAA
jgi:hypothetical protein